MGLFTRKHKPELVDFTALQKRGILEKREEIFKQEIIDKGSSVFAGNNSGGGVDFLNSLAGAGINNNENTSITESLREARKKSGFNAEINQLKVQIDNHDFKIDNLHNKIIELEKKLREKGI